MMGIEFDIYRPIEWVENGLLKSYSRRTHEVARRLARVGQWSVGAALMSFAVAFATPSYALSGAPNGVVEIDVLYGTPPPVPLVAELKAAKTIESPSPTRAVNRSFNELFDSMRSGKPLPMSASLLALAEQASKNRNEKVDVEAWAARLAKDIASARD